MSVKRSRIGRSSSSGEIDFINHLPPPINSPDLPRDVRKAPNLAISNPLPDISGMIPTPLAVETEQPRRSIMSLSSPVREMYSERLDLVTDKCYCCKRKIGGEKSVFMYRGCAFCTIECRTEQIELDESKNKLARTTSGQRRMKVMKNQFGPQHEKRVAPLY